MRCCLLKGWTDGPQETILVYTCYIYIFVNFYFYINIPQHLATQTVVTSRPGETTIGLAESVRRPQGSTPRASPVSRLRRPSWAESVLLELVPPGDEATSQRGPQRPQNETTKNVTSQHMPTPSIYKLILPSVGIAFNKHTVTVAHRSTYPRYPRVDPQS